MNFESMTNYLLEVEGLVASALLGSFNLKIVYCGHLMANSKK